MCSLSVLSVGHPSPDVVHVRKHTLSISAHCVYNDQWTVGEPGNEAIEPLYHTR